MSLSYYRSKRNTYRDLRKNLSRYSDRIKALLNESSDALRSRNQKMGSHPDSAEGRVSTTFEDRLAKHTSESNALINSFEFSRSALDSQITKASESEQYWQRRCHAEEWRLEELRREELRKLYE